MVTSWISFAWTFYFFAILLHYGSSTRRTKTGVTSPAHKGTRTKRAGSKKMVSVDTVRNHSEGEDLPLFSSDQVSTKLDTLVKAVINLSRCVDAMEE